MVFRLPDLQGRLPIVDSMGRPVTAFLRYFNIEFKGAIERQEAAQAEILAELQAVQATQQDEIDRLNRVLAGTEEFSAVNVDGVIVAENGGLSDGIVQTATIAPNSVSDSASATTPSTVSLNNTSQVTVQSVSITTAAGDRLDITASASFFSQGSAGGTRGDAVNRPTLTLYRGTTFLGGSRPITVWKDMQAYASGTIAATDFPPAGTHTIYLYSDLSATTDIVGLTADNRVLNVQRVKR